MPLGQLDSTPIVRVNHKTGRFESAKATAASISGRVMAIHYGRKKFTQDGAGKWSLECVSQDCRHGDANNGDTIQCMGSAWCRDCKSTLALAMSAGERKVLILETSASVATTIRDRLAPVISRGVAMDAVAARLGMAQFVGDVEIDRCHGVNPLVPVNGRSGGALRQRQAANGKLFGLEG